LATDSLDFGQQRSLKRSFRLAGMPEAHAHRFHDIVSVVTGVPIEGVLMLLHQGEGMIEKHYGENRLK